MVADSFGNFHWLRPVRLSHEACASHFRIAVDHATVRVNLEGNDHGSFYSCKSGKWGYPAEGIFPVENGSL